jgi:hypothetical protein
MSKTSAGSNPGHATTDTDIRFKSRFETSPSNPTLRSYGLRGDWGNIAELAATAFVALLIVCCRFERSDTEENSVVAESVSQSLLKDKAFSTFLDQNQPFELRPEMGFRRRQKPAQPMAHHRQQLHQATSARQIEVAPLGLIAIASAHSGCPVACSP